MERATNHSISLPFINQPKKRLTFLFWLIHSVLLNGMDWLKKYYNSKVAYYIHGQYDLLMEEGNWRNQINQLNLNGGCNAARHQQNQQITSISSSEWADWWFVVCCGGCGKRVKWICEIDCFLSSSLVGYGRCQRQGLRQREENKRKQSLNKWMEPTCSFSSINFVDWEEKWTACGDWLVDLLSALFLLWVSGAGTAQCSAKEREQSRKAN